MESKLGFHSTRCCSSAGTTGTTHQVPIVVSIVFSEVPNSETLGTHGRHGSHFFHVRRWGAKLIFYIRNTPTPPTHPRCGAGRRREHGCVLREAGSSGLRVGENEVLP